MSRKEWREHVLWWALSVVLGIFIALPWPGQAQIVLTIDGKCVPTTCSTTPPPIDPPKCTPPATWNGSSCVTPTPPPPVAGVVIIDANPPFHNQSQPLTAQGLGADQVLAYRIPKGSFENSLWTLYQPSNPASMSISAIPGDFGPGPSNTGCYMTAPGNNPQQISIRSVRGAAPAYQVCPTPVSIDGYLYVSVRWPVYTSFSPGSLTNQVKTQGKTQGEWQFRRDP